MCRRGAPAVLQPTSEWRGIFSDLCRVLSISKGAVPRCSGLSEGTPIMGLASHRRKRATRSTLRPEAKTTHCTRVSSIHSHLLWPHDTRRPTRGGHVLPVFTVFFLKGIISLSSQPNLIGGRRLPREGGRREASPFRRATRPSTHHILSAHLIAFKRLLPSTPLHAQSHKFYSSA